MEKEHDEERWLPVVGYESWYEISDRGRVKRVGKATGAIPFRMLKENHGGGNGSPKVTLCINNIPRILYIKDIVAEAFLSTGKGEYVVAHINGDRFDNNVSNLRLDNIKIDNLEEWMPVVGYENLYEVSNYGRIKRTGGECGATVGKILKPQSNLTGYKHIQLYKDRSGHTNTVHRTVMAAFVGPRPNDMQINHKDGNKENNRLDNLEYVTASENKLHAFRTGLQTALRGEEHAMAVLTEKDVIEIRSLVGKVTYRDLADMFGVSLTAIFAVANHKSWAWLREGDDD